MLIETASQTWRKVRRTSSTESAFGSRVPARTQPATAAVATATSQELIQPPGQSELTAATQNIIQFLFYGTGSNNQTFAARLYGWAPIQPLDPDPQKQLWIPTLLAEFTAITLSSTFPGFAGCPIGAAEFFADTVTLNIGNASKVIVTSPGTTTADIGIACAEVDFTGFPILELGFSIAGGGVTDMNALFRMF